jgi:hypothetical protein
MLECTPRGGEAGESGGAVERRGGSSFFGQSLRLAGTANECCRGETRVLARERRVNFQKQRKTYFTAGTGMTV